MSATGNDTSSVNSPVGRAEFVPRPTRGKKRKTPAHLVQSPRPPAYQLDLPALLSTSPLPENIIQQALEDLDQVTPAAFQVVYATNAGLPQSERLLFPIADADGLWTLGFMDKRLQTIFIYNPRLISKPEAGIAKVNTMLNTTSYSIVRTAPVLCEEDNDSGVILLASAFYIAVGHRIPPCLNLDYWRCFLYSFLKTLHDKNVDTATQLSNGHLGYRGDASSSILELCRAWLRRETCLSESALDVSKIIASIETNKNQYPEKYVTSLKKAKTFRKPVSCSTKHGAAGQGATRHERGGGEARLLKARCSGAKAALPSFTLEAASSGYSSFLIFLGGTALGVLERGR
ncbi:hypothetical protein B0T10DRAFT_493971, partial [Thelonectria olida]